jgi:hypothetical protein
MLAQALSEFLERTLWIQDTASHALEAFRPRSLEHRQLSSWRDLVGIWTIEVAPSGNAPRGQRSKRSPLL